MVKFQRPRRQGAIAPMTAVCSVFVLGMVAFAVDTSWIVLTQTELQCAADAAALAGASKMMDNYVTYRLPGQSAAQKTNLLNAAMTTARASAKSYATANSAGGVSSLNLIDGDIEFGYKDSKGNYSAIPSFTGYPNTVKVVLRRDSAANSPLGLFFAPVIGTKNISLTATASASLYAGTVDSFKSSTVNSGMLPMTYDVNHWNSFVSTGKDPDGQTTTDSSGNPSISIYPSNKYKGNFGELSLDDSHNGTSEIVAWINDGLAPSDIQDLKNSQVIPLSSHDPNKWDWQGNPGMRAKTIMEVNDYEGKTFLLPLYKPVDSSDKNYAAGVGQGSNYFYNIVQFVGVKIVVLPGQQTNKQIVVQPSATIDPNAIFDAKGATLLDTTSSTLTTTFTTPKLTN